MNEQQLFADVCVAIGFVLGGFAGLSIGHAIGFVRGYERAKEIFLPVGHWAQHK